MTPQIRTIKISSKRQITIPKSYSAFKQGENVLVINEGNKIIIKPMPKNISETALLSQTALAESWNSAEDDEAFAYLQ